MVTNYPASHGSLATSSPAQEEGLGFRVIDWLRQAFCAIHGHDTMLHFQHERMSLRCVSCGHETPGWTLNQARPTVKLRGDARRHALARPHLVSARRIA
jgi:hypothetical protein